MRLEVAARNRIRKDNRRQLGTIDAAIGSQDVCAKSGGDRRSRLGTGCHHAVREHVGVQTRHTAPAELLEHVLLPVAIPPVRATLSIEYSVRVYPALPARSCPVEPQPSACS